MDSFTKFPVNYQWYDFVGNVGVFLILVAYLHLQLDKISNKSANFGFLNAVGALFILVSL